MTLDECLAAVYGNTYFDLPKILLFELLLHSAVRRQKHYLFADKVTKKYKLKILFMYVTYTYNCDTPNGSHSLGAYTVSEF